MIGQPKAVSWEDLTAEMDFVMMPEDQISEHHKLWHAPGADHARLAAAIRADIEQRRPQAADIAKRVRMLLQASNAMTPKDWQGDASSVVQKLKRRAGLDKVPKPPAPSRH